MGRRERKVRGGEGVISEHLKADRDRRREEGKEREILALIWTILLFFLVVGCVA